MEKDELKKQMMGLWKENFHDSDEYIKLVFDRYFDVDNVEYEELDGRVIASLMAVPYVFGNDNYAINGVYLCGLSTHFRHRGEGIMTRLLEKTEEKMGSRGYAFMFLIPANKGLIRYYKDRGYISGFYKTALHYTSLHDFRRDYFSTIPLDENALSEVKKRYFDALSVEAIDKLEALREDEISGQIIAFIEECERHQKGLSIYQSASQLATVLEELIISGGKIVVCRNASGEIAGIGLYSQGDGEFVEIGRFAMNYGALCKLRETVLLLGDGRNLTVVQYGYEKSHSSSEVWNPMFSTVLPEAEQVGAVGTMERVYNPNSHSEIYGMVRILSISEILKFMSNCRRDLKYSILTRQEKDGKIFEFSSKNGHMNAREVHIENGGDGCCNDENKNKKIVHIKDSAGYERIVLTERDLGEILFRRPGGDRMIEEAFGLPALNGRISLLLD
ncbi:MAG: GNAT family N-acetyltransferase [Muribaculaceae bacterium]|nr:GNAT family N-acetyltransferase [Muribaculaceae bacterium]